MEVAPHNKQDSEADAQATLAQHGYNEVREEPSRLRAIVKRRRGPIPWMLESPLCLRLPCGDD
jgi:H+-transporting ATPase